MKDICPTPTLDPNLVKSRLPPQWLNCFQILPGKRMHSTLGLYSLSGKTSYCQISWSLEAARLDVAMVVSLWNLTGTSAAALPRYLPNFRAIGKVSTRISRLRDFTRSCGKTSYRLVNRGPENAWLAKSFSKKRQNLQSKLIVWRGHDNGIKTNISYTLFLM